MPAHSQRATSLLAYPPTSHSATVHYWATSSKADATECLFEANRCILPFDDRAPIGLSFASSPDALVAIHRNLHSRQELLEGLLQELKAKAKYGAHKTVPWITWRIPHQLLDATEVTELLYFVGRSFQLDDRSNGFYCVSFNCQEVCPDRIALFKGLGFDALELVIDQKTSAFFSTLPQAEQQSMLAPIAHLSEDYHFPFLNLRLEHYIDNLPQRLRLCAQNGTRLPDKITLGKNLDISFHEFSTLYRGLRNMNYRVLGNDCFVRPQNPLAIAQNHHQLALCHEGFNSVNVRDIIGLGPANTTLLKGFYQQSPSLLQDYFSHTAFLPVTSRTPGAVENVILEELLCYHQIDLSYFTHRYQLAIKPLLKAAWKPLERQYGATLYYIKDDQLTLSADGVTRLSFMCQALLSRTQ